MTVNFTDHFKILGYVTLLAPNLDVAPRFLENLWTLIYEHLSGTNILCSTFECRKSLYLDNNLFLLIKVLALIAINL